MDFHFEGPIYRVLRSLLLHAPERPQDGSHSPSGHAEHCISRMQLDANHFETEKVTIKKVASVLLDLYVWNLCAVLFTNSVCLFGLAYFSPSIVEALGYSSTTTQLMTVPPYACGLLVTMLIALIGAALLLVGRSLATRYAALVIFVTGIYSCSPCLISWAPNNSAGYNRRATAIAMGFISTSSRGS